MLPRVSIRRSAAPRVLVGTDLVEVAQVAESIRRFGERYLSRVYTPNERRDCMRPEGHSPRRLAARFAVKEAVIKVLRPTPSDALPWTSIEVVRTAEGGCSVRLTGAARTLAKRTGLSAFAVSLSHEERYATAVVVVERASRPAARATARAAKVTAR